MEIGKEILALIWLNPLLMLINLASIESLKESNINFIWSAIVGDESDADAVVTTVDTDGAVTAGGAFPFKTSGSTTTLEV